MAIYEYTATDEVGSQFSGTYRDIDSTVVLRDELAKAGYTLVSARRARDPSRKRRRIKQREVVAFAYKFAGMYTAGLSVIRCLETMEDQTEDVALKNVIIDIRQSVEAGSSLKTAFQKYNAIFSDFFLGMIEAGETSGKLSKALEMSAAYLEKRAELRQKVRSAFIYPIAVGVVCIIVVTCLLIFVVPTFTQLYKRLHVDLPGPTKMLVMLSMAIRSWWWAIPFVVVAGVFALRRLLKYEFVRSRWDRFKFNVPVFARLNRTVAVSQFIRTFAMLISVGVPLIEAFDVASQVAHNHRISDIARDLQKSVKAGNPVAKSLKVHDIFPPMVVQLAASGEQAGVLPDMLNKAADFLDKDIDRMVASLLVKLEPALTVFMGIIVGLILMAVYLPMFDYMASLT
jgi:type IV pilus assembly protein PilC